MSTSVAPATISQHSNNFDLLRLIAAWLILFGHSFTLYDHSTDPLVKWLDYYASTWLALSIFFVISGYLVTASYLKHRDFLTYVRNRMYRIVPGLLVATLLCTFLLGPLVTTLSPYEYFFHPETWKYLNNVLVFPLRYSLPGVFADAPYPNVVNGSLWSLKVEVRAYILLMILGVIGMLRGSTALALAFALLVVHALATHLLGPDVKRIAGLKVSYIISNSWWLFAFFAGSALYCWRSIIPLTLFGFLSLLGLSLLGWYALPGGQYLHALLLPYLIIYLAVAAQPISGFLRGQDLSYGIYLYGFPMQQLVLYLTGKTLGMTGFIAVSTLLTLLCAACSWYYVERPWLKKSRWRQR